MALHHCHLQRSLLSILILLAAASSCGDGGRPRREARPPDAALDSGRPRDAAAGADARCPDWDSDGLCDADDPCPRDPDTSPADLDADSVPDVCDPDRDGDGAFPPADCDDGDPTRGPDVPERCGNSIDDNCDGVIGTEAYYRLPVMVTVSEELRDGVLHIVLEDTRILSHLDSPQSLRAYPVAVPEPWAEPYTGWPLYVEETSDGDLSVWLRVTLEPTEPSTIHLYYGPDTPSVSDPRPVFDFFETFDDEAALDRFSLESSRSGASQAIDTTYHGTPPASLRTQLQVSSGCSSNQWARSTFTGSFEAGAWLFAWAGRGKECSSCTISQALWVDGELQAMVPETGPELTPGEVSLSLTEGEHRVSVGMHTTTICRGTFSAWTDDLRWGRTTDPAPFVLVDASREEEVCR